MILTKVKTSAANLLLLAFVVFGPGMLAPSHATTKDDPKSKEADKPSARADLPGKPDAVQMELRQMRGTWVTTITENWVQNGKALPPQKKKITFVISDDKWYRLGDDGLFDDEMTLNVNPTQNPKAIDLADPRFGTFLGIYQLERDSLRFYLGPDWRKRPSEIPAKESPWLDLKRVSRIPVKTSQRFPNAPGCYWLLQPCTPPGVMATAGIVFIYEKDRDGAPFVTLASAATGNRTAEYRPVLVDAGKNRYLPELNAGGSSGGPDGPVVSLNRWRMDPKILPADKIAWIGIEALTPEAHRIAARQALEQAKKEQLEVLPWPELGQPYSFTLTTVDGRKIRSGDLKGKVVLLDCWHCL